MKIIRINHLNQSANRVFQYLFALSLADRVPSAAVYGFDLDIFGVRDWRPQPAQQSRSLHVTAGHDIDLARLAWLMNQDVVDDLTLQIYGIRMEYLPDPKVAREILFSHAVVGPVIDQVCIHVRAGDILSGVHKDYKPLPVSYYRAIIKESGLPAVFVGQIDDSPYCAALRRAFPEARFHAQAAPIEDFLTLMRSRHVAPAISSFSWLASWMSPVAERIFLPVAGLLDPLQRPDVDLLPHRDPRYRFRRLKLTRWKGTNADLDALLNGSLAGEPIEAEEIRTLQRQALEGSPILTGSMDHFAKDSLVKNGLRRLARFSIARR